MRRSLVELGDDVVAFSEEGGWTRSLASLPEQDELTPVRQFLDRVGYQLLLSTKHVRDPQEWPNARCQASALGYSKLEQLVVFAYNTPTATLTPLWKEGHFRATDWLPLFPRRDEKSPPVVPDD